MITILQDHQRPFVVFALTAALLLVSSCTNRIEQQEAQDLHIDAAITQQPGESAYDVAGRIQLPTAKPKDEGALEHVVRLSDNIVSGAEPATPQSLRQIADMGVKTVISVDGKAPDHETAKALGLRYVHIPIRYSGVSEEEKLAIAKTFRELEGPFYVHCFHGEHRGPAAVAIGRVVLDGATRQQAVAEMRQYCGTSKKYEGLYQAVAFEWLPTQKETAEFAFDFPPAYRVDSTRQAMVELTRPFDLLKASNKRAFASDPDHPDVVPAQEAIKLSQFMRMFNDLPGTQKRPEDYRQWAKQSVDYADELARHLGAFSGGDASALEKVKASYKALDQSCNACHQAYRN